MTILVLGKWKGKDAYRIDIFLQVKWIVKMFPLALSALPCSMGPLQHHTMDPLLQYTTGLLLLCTISPQWKKQRITF